MQLLLQQQEHAATTFYRPGDRALFNGKHWQAVRTGTLPQPVATQSFGKRCMSTGAGLPP